MYCYLCIYIKLLELKNMDIDVHIYMYIYICIITIFVIRWPSILNRGCIHVFFLTPTKASSQRRKARQHGYMTLEHSYLSIFNSYKYLLLCIGGMYHKC